MVDYYRYRMTKAVSKMDPDLYCDEYMDGYAIFRRHMTLGVPIDFEGDVIRETLNQPQMILPLTDSWGVNGRPVEWGVCPVYFRLKEIDAWTNNDHHTTRWEEEYEKSQESKARKRRNDQEAFLKDFRGQFAKAFEHVNTSTVNKRDRRRIDEKKHNLK